MATERATSPMVSEVAEEANGSSAGGHEAPNIAVPPMVSGRVPNGVSDFRVAQFLADAQDHAAFRNLWNGVGHDAFRAFVFAALRFGRLSEVADNARSGVYAALATANRAELLDQLSGLKGWKRCLRLLAKTEYESFEARDWRELLRITEDAHARRALGHVETISPRLVRQFSQAPEAARIPAVLRILGALDVSEANWRRLAAALEDAPTEIRPSLIAKARRAKTFGDFWDFVFDCLERAWRPFDLPPQFLTSPTLRPLRNRKELEHEGKLMNNCLASEVAEVRAGRRVYFRWQGTHPANVQLLRSRSGWHLGQILGPHSRPLSPLDVEPIVDHAMEMIAAAGNETPPLQDDRVATVMALGETARHVFVACELDRVGAALRKLRGASKGPGPDTSAFCILEAEHGYIQFMDIDGGREFRCEIQSHRFSEALDRSMKNDIVDLIERAGFSWPGAKQNFVRRISVRSDLEIDTASAFALGVLAKVFGFRHGKALSVKPHLP